MSKGKAVAQGEKNSIFSFEKEEYTKMLIEKKMAVMNRYREILHNGRRKTYVAGS